MADLEYYLKNLQFFDISLLYYYINLRSSITGCLSTGDIYINIYFFGNSLSNYVFFVSLAMVFDLFCDELLKAFATLSAILLPIKSTVASAAF